MITVHTQFNPISYSTPLLLATNEQINVSEILSIVNNQIQLIGVISTIFLGLIPIILGLIAFQVWKSDETRKRIEEDALAIENFRTQSNEMFTEISLKKTTIFDELGDMKKTIDSIKRKEDTADSEKLKNLQTTIERIKDELLKEKNKLISNQQNLSDDVRFNLFLSPKHIKHLDKVARNKMIPRTVYLRQLLDNDIQNNE